MAESNAVLVNTKQERENFANGGVKFVSRAYDMRCRKLPFITNRAHQMGSCPGIIHLRKGSGGLLNGAAYNRNEKSPSKQAKAVLI